MDYPSTPDTVQTTQAPSRGFHWGYLFGGVFGGCIFSFLLFVGTCLFMLICLARLFGSEPEPTAQDYATIRGDGERRVLRLELSGVITGLETSRWYVDASSDVAVRRAIEEATTEDFDALLLVVDSPGGGVTASDALYHALENFKQADPTRKVVVMGGDIVASGAYYLAMQADWIRLQPTSIVGSIGVIVPGVNAAGLAEKLGLQDNSIASGASKDLGNPLKPINPEHNLILKEVVDGMYERFVTLVAEGRNLPVETVRSLADGRVYLAEKAVALGLVDDIGYEDTLDEKLAELLECRTEDLTVVQLTTEEDFFGALLSDLPAAVGRSITEPFARQQQRTPEYRW